MSKREPFNPQRIQSPVGGQSLFSATVPTGPMTVGQLTARIKHALEIALPPTVHVLGEISNCKRHSSGHLYLTLKDSGSELSCVMWKSDAAKLKFAPQDGMEVIATGGVEVFERSGRYQLYIRRLEPRGVGALELAFRQLCEKLTREGLFDPSSKKTLPPYPQRIALVTSPTGAAIADLLRAITRRYPCVDVLLYPVRVQGDGAAGEIAGAIRRLNEQSPSLGGIDVLIVGRGGGSLEDLWAFNAEIVARAIFSSHIPIISAVGHETDVTIADLVADVRAATPTAAAEIAVPVLADVVADLAQVAARMRRTLVAGVAVLQARLSGAERQTIFRDPATLLRRRAQLVDELESRAHRTLVERLGRMRRRLDRLDPVMQRVAPHAVLLRTMHRMRNAELRLAALSPRMLIARARQRMDHLVGGIEATLRHRRTLAVKTVEHQEGRLAALGYRSVLNRGFSITRMARGRDVVRSAAELRDGQRLITEVIDGTFESEVVNRHQRQLFDADNLDRTP